MIRSLISAWIKSSKPGYPLEVSGTAAVYRLTITTQRSTSVKFEIVFSATEDDDYDDTIPLYNSRSAAYAHLKRLGYRQSNASA